MSNINNDTNLGNIRKARIEDLETIVKFNYNLAKETEDKELNLEILSNGVRAMIEDSSKGQYYVCEVNDRVVGQIMFTYEWSDWRNGMFLWVQSVYVDSEYRKKVFIRSCIIMLRIYVIIMME